MNKTETGGPAFPIFPETGGGHAAAFAGMTLRDYFAAKALQGMLSDLPITLYGPDCDKNTAALAYSIADAMLEARK